MCCGAETRREGERAVGEENTTHDRGLWLAVLLCYCSFSLRGSTVRSPFSARVSQSERLELVTTTTGALLLLFLSVCNLHAVHFALGLFHLSTACVLRALAFCFPSCVLDNSGLSLSTERTD